MRQKQIWRHIQKPRLVQKCLRGQYKDKERSGQSRQGKWTKQTRKMDKADKENEQNRQGK